MKENILVLRDKQPDLKFILGIILFATLTRLALPPFLEHPSNFSALNATALFCGAYLHRRFLACLVDLLSVWIGYIFLSKIMLVHWHLFYSGFYWQYACYVLITLLGGTLKNPLKPLLLVSACLTSSILFFAISNWGVWSSGFLYPLTRDGLIACYIAALPFFKNTVLSDLFFTLVLFSASSLVYPRLWFFTQSFRYKSSHVH